jgi:hypothetical protein
MFISIRLFHYSLRTELTQYKYTITVSSYFRVKHTRSSLASYIESTEIWYRHRSELVTSSVWVDSWNILVSIAAAENGNKEAISNI